MLEISLEYKKINIFLALTQIVGLIVIVFIFLLSLQYYSPLLESSARD